MGGAIPQLDYWLVFRAPERPRIFLSVAEREVYGARIRAAEAITDLSSSHRLVLVNMSKLAARGCCFASQEEIRKRSGLKSVRTVSRAWVVLRKRGLIIPKVLPSRRTRAWDVLPHIKVGQFVRSNRSECPIDERQNVRQNKEQIKNKLYTPADQELQRRTEEQPVSAEQMRELLTSLALDRHSPACSALDLTKARVTENGFRNPRGGR